MQRLIKRRGAAAAGRVFAAYRLRTKASERVLASTRSLARLPTNTLNKKTRQQARLSVCMHAPQRGALLNVQARRDVIGVFQILASDFCYLRIASIDSNRSAIFAL